MGRRRCCCGPPPGTPRVIQVRSCGSPVPAGVVVKVYSNSGKATLLAEGVTDSSGNFAFNLNGSGTWYVWVDSPHARILDTGSTVTVAAAMTVFLSPASGYTCCYAAYRDPGDPDAWIPRSNRLKVTTSAGGEWEMAGCAGEYCTESDILKVAFDLGPIVPIEGPYGTCYYRDFPVITEGRIGIFVKISRHVSGKFQASLTTVAGTGNDRFDPMTYDLCRGPVSGTPNRKYKYWYDGSFDCARYQQPRLFDSLVDGVVASNRPLSVTFSFASGGDAWEFDYPHGSSGPFPRRPPPLASITLAELD